MENMLNLAYIFLVCLFSLYVFVVLLWRVGRTLGRSGQQIIRKSRWVQRYKRWLQGK